jgi:hypothetical protein
MGHKILDIFAFALKVVVGIAIVLLIVSAIPPSSGQGAISEALQGIGGAIGQLDDLIRDIRNAV